MSFLSKLIQRILGRLREVALPASAAAVLSPRTSAAADPGDAPIPPKKPLKIGFLDQTCLGWSGGSSYTRAMLSSIALNWKDAGQQDEEWLFLSQGKIQAPKPFKEVLSAQFKDDADGNLPDVVIPVRDQIVKKIPVPMVGWIPDFQHCRLPGLFSDSDISSRDSLFKKIAQSCQLVVLSSEDAQQDFQEFLPDYIEKTRIARFASQLWDEKLQAEPQEVCRKYRLPERFALVVNQFWKHKNHSLLPTALAEAKRQGVEVALVLTGLPSDYRDLENHLLSSFFQECATMDLHHQIYFLGYLPYQEMISLMRCAAVLIQPSHFEGWNTSIEDAKALGRPVLCSDLPVHQEQLPDALGFFSGQAPEQLAELLVKHFPTLPPGPDLAQEATCLAAAKERSKVFGGILLAAAREAATMPKSKVKIKKA